MNQDLRSAYSPYRTRFTLGEFCLLLYSIMLFYGFYAQNVLAILVGRYYSFDNDFLRGFSLVSALVWIILGRKKIVFSKPIICLLIFFLLYGGRVFLDGFILEKDLSRSTISILLQLYGVVFIPALPFLFLNSARDVYIVSTGILSGLTIVSITLIVYFSDILSFGLITGRAEDELFNPLQLSYLGSACILAAFSGLNYFGKLTYRYRIWTISVGVLGLFPFVIGSSRGSVLSLTLGVLALILFQREKKIAKSLFLVVPFAVGMLFLFDYFINSTGSNITERILLTYYQLSSGIDTFSRYNIWLSGLNEFLNSPLFGSGIEVSSVRFYPHNLILEAFMATGIFGVLFLIPLTTALKSLRLNFRIGFSESLLAALFINYSIHSMFSGSFYLNNFFISIMVILLVIRDLNSKSKTFKRPNL